MEKGKADQMEETALRNTTTEFGSLVIDCFVPWNTTEVPQGPSIIQDVVDHGLLQGWITS